MPFTIKQ